MADSTGENISERGKQPVLHKLDEIISKRSVIEEGNPTKYRLERNTETCGKYRKITFGERNEEIRNKTILMVGETGIGKTKLINTMINYKLGVKREDKLWYEVTDDQSEQTQAHSQTSIITLYGFYAGSQTDLTIIDTPGYGNTSGIEKDKEIALSLLSLCESDQNFREIHAVCLVIKASQSRLSDRQLYVLDAVQSLFGHDIAENIVLLITHSRGAIPKNILNAVKEAKIKCAINDEDQPVYFMFDNCQSEAADEEDKMLEQSWDLSFKGMKGFYKFLEHIKSKTLKTTQTVLKQRARFDINISKFQPLSQKIKQMENELKQTQEVLEMKKKKLEDNANFEEEVDVPCKVKTKTDPSAAKNVMCCNDCEENCHDNGWWMLFSSNCKKCSQKCAYARHTKGYIFVAQTKKEKRTSEALKKSLKDEIEKDESVAKKLEEELQELEKEKLKLMIDTFHCVDALEMIALNTDSVLTLLHIDFLIEKLKEINETEKAKTLENIKGRAGEDKHKVLKYIKKIC